MTPLRRSPNSHGPLYAWNERPGFYDKHHDGHSVFEAHVARPRALGAPEDEIPSINALVPAPTEGGHA